MELGNFLTENQQKSSLASNVLAHFYCPWRGSQRSMGGPNHGNPVIPEEALLMIFPGSSAALLTASQT